MWPIWSLFKVVHQRSVSGGQRCGSFDNELAAGFSESLAEEGNEVLSAAMVVGRGQGRQSAWSVDASRVVDGGGALNECRT